MQAEESKTIKVQALHPKGLRGDRDKSEAKESLRAGGIQPAEFEFLTLTDCVHLGLVDGNSLG
eukprot:6441258-Amphidinium_carterae.1